MPLFRFQAVHVGGRKTTGVIEADSLSMAKERLRLENMLITDVFPYDEPRKKASIPPSQLLDITRMISQLQSAGIPLFETLVIIEEKYRKVSFHPLIIDLCDRVKKGEALSLALSHYSHTFDPIYISMTKAGEESGNFTFSFQQLTQLLEDKGRLRKQIMAAIAYPLFLGIFCIIVFLSMLIWVIPSLKNLFEDRALHPLTQFVFHLSDFFLNNALLIGLGCIAAILVSFFTLTHSKLRVYWDHFFLRFPLIGSLIMLSATTRFCRTCSLLLEGGTPLLHTLHLSNGVLKNKILEKEATIAEKHVSEGVPLSQQTHWMPPLVSHMLAVGEKTGQIASMFRHISTLCEDDLTRALQRYTSLIQPLLLLVLGLLIGTVILSILIPLTDVGSVLQG